ncbi:hypothetical protein ACIBAG_23570 [Streptomyces sp. NPDC051243]|uniref:hypothetical protein n=1 Tax=Streptomyces sp. NPDC051243 TaxID=3365646 RepID=UPI00379BCF01
MPTLPDPLTANTGTCVRLPRLHRWPAGTKAILGTLLPLLPDDIDGVEQGGDYS